MYRFFLSISTVLLLGACDSKAPVSDENVVSQVRPAKLFTIEVLNNNDFLNYPAVIKSQQLSVLSFEVSGKLTKLPIIEAQNVKKGEILAKLDQRNLLAKLKSVQAQFNNANAEYKRALRLIKEKAISQSILEQRKSQNDVSKAQLETAQKALEDSVLIAPYTGTIAKISIKKRQLIQAGKPAITILGKKGLEATINLPSSIMAKAKEQKTQAKDSYLVLDVAPNRHIPIMFKEASLEADTTSQTYAITFSFDTVADLNILPGMNAIVWFRDPSQSIKVSNKITVPLTAIAIDGNQKYVWVVDTSTMIVSKRNIIVQIGVGRNIVISSGLKLGETIVSAGISALSEGMKVSAWSSRN